MESRPPMEAPSLQVRLDAAKAAQVMRSRLSVATRKLKSDHPSLPFPDLQPPPQLPLSPAFLEEPNLPQPSQTALGKRKLVEPNGLGYGGELGGAGGGSREESALGRGGRGGGSVGAQTSRTTPKQNLYEMLLGPRADHLDQHDDGGGLGGLGYGFPSGPTSSGTNGTSSFHNYRGVSSTHHRLPPPASSSPYDQPYDNQPMSPSLYLNSPDPNQFTTSSSSFFPSSHNPFPLRPRTPSSSTRDDTSKAYSSLFPTTSSSSYGRDDSNDNDPFIVSTGPRHLDAPYSPRRGPRIVSDSGPLNFAAASPRGIGLGTGGAFGRSPSATYSSSSHHLNANAGAAASFSFAQNHTTSPVITSSPQMSSSRTSMMPSRPPPIASPSGPLYPSNLGMGGAGVFPPRLAPGAGASPSSYEGGGGQPQRGHRRAISSTLSAVVNFQASRRPVNNNTSPERKRRLPSGGHFSPSSSPDKKKRRALSYGALPPPELPLRKKTGASRLGATDVTPGLEESAASALASMLASSSSTYGSAGGRDSSDGGGVDGAVGGASTSTGGGGSGRARATGTPPPPSGADATAAGMLIFLHHSPSPAKTKSSARTPGGGMGTPGRGRVLMFDDHPPTPPKPALPPASSSSSTSNPPPQFNPTLSRPPSFTTTPSSSQEGLVNLSLPSPPPPQARRHLEPTSSTSTQPDAALSPPGPFFSPPLKSALPSPLLLSQGSCLEDVPMQEERTRKDEPEDIMGSQKDPRPRTLPSPSPTLAPRAEIQQGPTPSWPDFDFLTSSSGDRTPTPPHLSGEEKISGLV